jgi:enamine deaminase RidA (YjgF/YER057c/UK114 family)
MEFLHPPHWKKPKGYSNGISTTGRMVYIAGQIGWNAEEQFETDDLFEQVEQALKNVKSVLDEAGGKPEHITRMTWYVTSKKEYLSEPKRLGAAYRSVMGQHYPAMTAVEVNALMEDRAKVEIECDAVVPI